MAFAEPRPGAAIDARVVKALSHPTRVRILSLLGDRELVSPVELANEFGLALGTVGYHVRRLEALGFIELAKRTQRRGAVEHHYRACATLAAEAPAAPAGRGALGPGGRAALDVCAAAEAAVAQGGFDRPGARCELRVPTLDERGEADLERAEGEWEATLARIERDAARRLARRAAPPARDCTVVTLHFDPD